MGEWSKHSTGGGRVEEGGRTRVCDSRRGDLFFSGNVVAHLTAEEEEEQDTESVLGCALRRLSRVFGSNAPPTPLSFYLKAPVAP